MIIRYRLLFTLTLLWIGSLSLVAQLHSSILPDLEGEELKAALIDQYKTNTVLSYSEARDTFMGIIDQRDGKLSCVYTGYTITMDPSADPTTFAFANDINTEHSYPRSKGALEGTLAYSDMHHLFPTRVNVNSDRGSLPYGEINDNQTDKWYYNNTTTSQKPSQNIDDYSEYLSNQRFEPREDFKGDIARAYFYFRTMYEQQSISEDPEFFPSQVEELCLWHAVDPVDQKEWDRNQGIAKYQDNKVNPFILDCRLARMYCEEISQACLLVDVVDVKDHEISAFPNPTSRNLTIDSDVEGSVIIYGQDGTLVERLTIKKGKNILVSSDYPKGLLILNIYSTDNQLVKTTKIINI